MQLRVLIRPGESQSLRVLIVRLSLRIQLNWSARLNRP